jgi:hypothetical protein
VTRKISASIHVLHNRSTSIFKTEITLWKPCALISVTLHGKILVEGYCTIETRGFTHNLNIDIDIFLTAIGLTRRGSSTVHIYKQTIHRTTQLIWEECGPCHVFASYTLEFALQLRKKHGKTSVRVAEECQLAR